MLVAIFGILPFYWDRSRPDNPQVEARDAQSLFPPLILATSLEDSLPAEVVADLDVADVKGVKIKYRDGLYASYYKYSADREKLLSALAQLAIPIQDRIADTSYRKLTPAELEMLKQTIRIQELENCHDFWTVHSDEFDIFESLKPPFRHLILLGKADRTVLHRVTPLV